MIDPQEILSIPISTFQFKHNLQVSIFKSLYLN